MKAGPIASWTGIKRGLVYKVLEQLIILGLVIKNENKGSVAIFSPTHPSRLIEMIDKKEKDLILTKDIISSSIGSLSSKFNLLQGKPTVQFFEGRKGVEKILQDTLNSKTEVLTYLDMETVEKYFKDINDKYVAKRKENSSKKRILALNTEFTKNLFKKWNNENPDYFKITNIKMVNTPLNNIEGSIQIYEDKIGIITISNQNIISIIIEDERINKLFKSMFEAIYATSSEFFTTP
jgi:sugar-specific transcriptional regulator TrmB